MNKQFEFKVGDMVKPLGKYKQASNVVFCTVIGTDCFYLLGNGCWYREFELKLDIPELTQAELQFLTKYLSDILFSSHTNIAVSKAIVSDVWGKCNPEDTNYFYFKELNIQKDSLNKEVAFNKKLSEIQRKLKKQQWN